MNYIYELTAQEKRLVDLIRNIRYGTVNEILVQDGIIQTVKVEYPAKVYGFKFVESTKVNIPIDK